MTALEYMEKQAQKHGHDLERELERNAPEEVIGNIIKKIGHYAIVLTEKGKTMGKARIYGLKTKYIPNSKADSRRKKPFTGAHKKGKAKK